MTIASAVEEQSATTNEMSRNVAEAATGTNEIASNIVGVAQAAATTTSGVTESNRAAADLARMSGELQQLVGSFRYRLHRLPGLPGRTIASRRCPQRDRPRPDRPSAVRRGGERCTRTAPSATAATSSAGGTTGR